MSGKRDVSLQSRYQRPSRIERPTRVGLRSVDQPVWLQGSPLETSQSFFDRMGVREYSGSGCPTLCCCCEESKRSHLWRARTPPRRVPSTDGSHGGFQSRVPGATLKVSRGALPGNVYGSFHELPNSPQRAVADECP